MDAAKKKTHTIDVNKIWSHEHTCTNDTEFPAQIHPLSRHTRTHTLHRWRDGEKHKQQDRNVGIPKIDACIWSDFSSSWHHERYRRKKKMGNNLTATIACSDDNSRFDRASCKLMRFIDFDACTIRIHPFVRCRFSWYERTVPKVVVFSEWD